MNTTSLEELLGQDQWLRRLAHRLTQDPHAAEDLAQQAWVTSLEGGRADEPWLFGVLRNGKRRWLRTRRSEADRLHRKAARADGPSQQPATDEVVADLQLREALWRELNALAEPLRTTLYLRYVEDLSQAAIAERMEVSPSTVSTRVRQGIEGLRGKLDRAYGGDRAAWSIGLVALAQKPTTSVGSSRALVALAPLLLGIGGFFALRPALGVDPTPAAYLGPDAQLATLEAPEPETQIFSVLGEAVERSVPPEDQEAATQVDAEQQALQNAVLRGRFTHPSGAPAAGGTWRLHGWPSNEDMVRLHGTPDDWSDPQGQLDDDGQVELNFGSHPAYQYTFEVHAQGSAPAKWRWGEFGERELKDLGDVALEPACRVSGRLFGIDGDPLPQGSWLVSARELRNRPPGGSRDRVRASEFAQGSELRFEFSELPPGPIQLQVQETTYGRSRTWTVEAKPEERVEVDLRLERSNTYQDRILITPRHEPFTTSLFDPAAEHIRLIAQDGTQREAKDRAGGLGFEIGNVGEGAYRLEITDPRFEPFSQNGLRAGDKVRADLMGSSSLRLSVQDPDGKPVELFEVEVVVELDGVSFYPNRYVLHDGSKALPGGRLLGLVPAHYTLTVSHEAYCTTTRIEDLRPGEERFVDLELTSPARVSGLVKGSDDLPASRTNVQLIRPAERNDSPATPILGKYSSSSHPGQFRWLIDERTTDPEGRFLFEIPAAGDYLIVIGKESGQQLESQVLSIAPGDVIGDLEFQLSATSALLGRVQAPPGIDLEGWCLEVHQEEDGAAVSRATLSSDGGFTFLELSQGTTRLFLLEPSLGQGLRVGGLPSGAVLLGTWELEEGRQVKCDLKVEGPLPCAITFRLQFPGQALELSQAWLVEQGKSGRRQDLVPLDREGTLAWQLDPQPVWVSPGTYRLNVHGPGWMYQHSAPIVSDSSRTSLELDIPVHLQTGRVRLVLAGVPLAGTGAWLRHEDPQGPMAFAKSDADGWCSFSAQGGSLSLRLRLDSGSIRTIPITWPLPTGELEVELE